MRAAVARLARRVSAPSAPLSRFVVEGPSMEPAYHAGDHLLVYRWAYVRRAPAPGDVVVLCDPEARERRLLKRVLAVHEAADGTLLVEVHGDNPAASRDSREFGPVPARLIIGRVWRRY